MRNIQDFCAKYTPRVTGIFNHVIETGADNCKILTEDKIAYCDIAKVGGYLMMNAQYPGKKSVKVYLHKIVYELEHQKFFPYKIQVEDKIQKMHISHRCNNKMCLNTQHMVYQSGRDRSGKVANRQKFLNPKSKTFGDKQLLPRNQTLRETNLEAMDTKTETVFIKTGNMTEPIETEDMETMGITPETKNMKPETIYTKSDTMQIKQEISYINSETMEIKQESMETKTDRLDVKLEVVDVKTEMVDVKIEPLDINIETVDVKEIFFDPDNADYNKSRSNNSLSQSIYSNLSMEIYSKSLSGSRSIAKEKLKLKSPIRSMHGDTWYPCDQCDFKSMQKGNLNLHVKTIHGTGQIKSSYLCNQCDFKSINKEYLFIHKEKVHESDSQSEFLDSLKVTKKVKDIQTFLLKDEQIEGIKVYRSGNDVYMVCKCGKQEKASENRGAKFNVTTFLNDHYNVFHSERAKKLGTKTS